MAYLETKIIESLLKDLENIKQFDTGKVLRKECSLLLKRVQDAKKLFASNHEMTSRLIEIEQQIQELKQ